MEDDTIINQNLTTLRKRKVRKLLIFVAAIALATATVITVCLVINKKNQPYNENLSYLFDPEKPILVMKDNLYGYVNTNGDEIIPLRYHQADEFFGEYAHAVILDTTNASATTLIINKKGEPILKPANALLDTLHGTWLIDGKLYDRELNQKSPENITVLYGLPNGFYKYQKDDTKEYGLMSSTGTIPYSCGEIDCEISIRPVSPLLNNYYALVSGDTILDLSSKADTLEPILISDVSSNPKTNLGNNIFAESAGNSTRNYYLYDGKAYEAPYGAQMSLYDALEPTIMLDFGSNYSATGENVRYKFFTATDRKISNSFPDGIPLDMNSAELAQYYIHKCEGDSSNKSLRKGKKEVFQCGQYIQYRALPTDLYAYLRHSQNKQLILAVDKDHNSHLIDLKTKKTLRSFDADNVSFSSKNTFATAMGNDKKLLVYNLLSGKSLEITNASIYSTVSNAIAITDKNSITYYNTNLDSMYSFEDKTERPSHGTTTPASPIVPSVPNSNPRPPAVPAADKI